MATHPAALDLILSIPKNLFQCSWEMDSIDIIKLLSTVLSSAIKESQQHQEKNSWECWESNPGLLGEKQVCNLCAMQKIFFRYSLTLTSSHQYHSFAILSGNPVSIPLWSQRPKQEQRIRFRWPKIIAAASVWTDLCRRKNWCRFFSVSDTFVSFSILRLRSCAASPQGVL